MTVKADFSGEDWKQLLQAPGAAGIYIMMADPNFVIGSMKEAFAVSSSIISKGKENNSELLSTLLAEFKEREMAKEAQLKFEKKNLESVKKTAFDALKNAAAVLDTKASPEEAKEIKAWLYDVSVKAANAAKEGGFLGFGGTKVSEKEKVALQEIANVLGVAS
ncbi:MAG: hypothetical protein DSY50_01800 [Desulfobulbus sp.]|nr:MAG: hypothetical protein DSY50_01800 [Desulfobulbus sp.]RUM37779.1 MAG: hypothetical protein DSY58_03235 [Desulfobulbus sp.]RUM41973.1 MAG: hypothetical protein DSY70_00205 [Desulfobulbus sp.]